MARGAKFDHEVEPAVAAWLKGRPPATLMEICEGAGLGRWRSGTVRARLDEMVAAGRARRTVVSEPGLRARFRWELAPPEG